MDVKIKALLWTEMVSSGIVPIDTELGVIKAKIDQQLEGLSDEDIRKLKRKFRKLWRLKKSYRHCRPGEPSASMMRRRKNEVFRMFYIRALKEIRETDPDYDVYPY